MERRGEQNGASWSSSKASVVLPLLRKFSVWTPVHPVSVQPRIANPAALTEQAAPRNSRRRLGGQQGVVGTVVSARLTE